MPSTFRIPDWFKIPGLIDTRRGAYVMPGGIDAHVHLCQDLQAGAHGLSGECADNFETGSRSAIAGGTTTMITFATQTRAEADRSLIGVVERYNQRAEATGSYNDYAFHVIVVRNDADVLENELPLLVKDWGVTSCKLFLTYETQRLSDRQLLDVMFAAKQNSITTVGRHTYIMIRGRPADLSTTDDTCGERRCHRMADRYLNIILISKHSHQVLIGLSER
jgi:dihydroorotase-like cyclic amidohydrolase